MKFIFLARKPSKKTADTLALETGVGSLNIRDCRSFTHGKTLGQCSYWPGPCLGHYNQRSVSGQVTHRNNLESEGRYPMNVIFQHHPNCVPLPPETETYKINRFKDGAKPFGNGAGHPYEGHEKTVQVERWDCSLECPSNLFKQTEAITQIPPDGIESYQTDGEVHE